MLLPFIHKVVQFALVQDTESSEKPALLLGESAQVSFWPAMMKMLFVLSLILGIIILLSWIIRRVSGAGAGLPSQKSMKIVTSLSLGNRQFISLIKAGGKHLLVGITQTSITKLDELSREEAEAFVTNEDGLHTGSFAGVLSRIMGKSKEEK